MSFAILFAGDSDEPVVVDVKCLRMSQTLSDIIKSCHVNNADCYRIPLPFMKYDLLEKVAVFLNHYTFEKIVTAKDLMRSQMDCLQMLDWDRDYLKGWGTDELIGLYDTAKRLQIKHLQEICTRKAKLIAKGKTLEEMRQNLRIDNEENCPCSLEPCCSKDECGCLDNPM